MFGDPVKNTMNWPRKPLNDVCDGIGDGLHGTPEYDDNGDYPFINGNNLIDGNIVITPATKMVAEDTYKKHLINICENAILISINGTLGKMAFYHGEKVMLGKSACYCNLKPDINKTFVYGVMKSDAFAEFLDNSSTKSTIKNVGLKAMREYQLILPPMELQEYFATFVEQTDKSKYHGEFTYEMEVAA
jgi:type I restriction enzyme S subunit